MLNLTYLYQQIQLFDRIKKGAHGQVAFFYPTQGLDLLIEICEVQDSPDMVA